MSEPTTTAAPRDPRMIGDYHAHVYYDPATTRETAARLRERVAAAFPEATLGRWHDELVGPHLRSMYQIAIPCALIGGVFSWPVLHPATLCPPLPPRTRPP